MPINTGTSQVPLTSRLSWEMHKWSCEQTLETAVDRNAFKDVPCCHCLFTCVAQPKGGETRGGQAKYWLRVERQGCYVTALQR